MTNMTGLKRRKSEAPDWPCKVVLCVEANLCPTCTFHSFACATHKKTVESWDGIRSSRYVSLRQRSTRRIALPLVSQPNQPINKSSLPSPYQPSNWSSCILSSIDSLPYSKTFSLGLTSCILSSSQHSGDFSDLEDVPLRPQFVQLVKLSGDAPIAAAANSFRCQWDFDIFRRMKELKVTESHQDISRPSPRALKDFFGSRTTGH